MQSLAAEDADKIRAFEMRLQQEGAAAFAAGPAPWEDWDDTGTLGTYRIWMDSVRHTPPPERPQRKPLTTRLLTGVAQLAVLALLVGTAGVYLSMVTPGPQLAQNGIQPPPIAVAGRPALRPVTAALPVVRSRPETDTLVEAPPAAETAMPADGAAGTPPVARVVPLLLEQKPAIPTDAPAEAADQALARTLDELPGTAAGPAMDATTAPASATVPTAEAADVQAKTPAPAAEDPPAQIALLTPAIDSLPAKPAAEPAPAQDARDLANTWVINLASYNFESMARRKLAAFRDKGVNAELVHITVKGKPMIRIRTTGYRSSREARDWVALLEERLELHGAWIAKYEPGEQ